MCFPDYTKKFILECDASDVGLGSVLRQDDKIIGYFSKKLKGSEKHYSIVEKKYLAILLSCIHFKNIIQGCYTEIYTDSRNCLFNNKKLCFRIERWKLLMNEFNHKIKRIEGKDNVIADTLSRCLQIETSEKDEYQKLIFKNSIRNSRGKILMDNKNRIIIKPMKQVLVLQNVHKLPGHRGVTTLMNNLKNHIYINKLFEKTRYVVGNCNTCIRSKTLTYKNNKENHIVASRKGERISMDIYGPFRIDGF
ncbi:MAG: RNase H-like domain-containing protein, partial [Lactobacillaceae bacterium]